MRLKCCISFCNHRPSCTTNVGCWFLFAYWQGNAVMRARKVSLWLRHGAPMTAVASQGGSVSLHHSICRVESPTWCELKFTLSGPHVCAIASGCGIFGCSTFLLIAIGFLLPCSPSPLAKARTGCEVTWDVNRSTGFRFEFPLCST